MAPKHIHRHLPPLPGQGHPLPGIISKPTVTLHILCHRCGRARCYTQISRYFTHGNLRPIFLQGNHEDLL